MDVISFEGTHKLMTAENLPLNAFQEELRSDERC